MFWGLILEPNRRYSQVVKKPFRVTMAALDVRASKQDPTQVIVTFQNKNFLACTLQKDDLRNQRLDLRFQEGDQISFAANGKSHVHLTGFLMEMEDFEFEDGDSEDDTEATTKVELRKRRNEQNDTPPAKKSKTLQLLENAVNSDSDNDSDFSLSKIPMPVSDDDGSGEDEEEDVDEEDDNDDEEELIESDEVEDDEDAEGEEDENDEEDDEDDEDVEEEEEVKESKSPVRQTADKKHVQEKKQNQVKKDTSIESDKSKGDKNEIQKNGSPQKKRIIEGGVSIEELKTGNGQVAKPGKFVHVYYEGRLKSNNKLFDSATKGAGFQFRLGRQEVIKGWDVGLVGMKVGGKRRIVCPPNMAYGAKGSPPAIPPNSTLVFEIELRKVK